MSSDRNPSDEHEPEYGYGLDLCSIEEHRVPDSPVCPLCGQSVSLVRITGPNEAIASPCGCRMPPEPFFTRPDDPSSH